MSDIPIAVLFLFVLGLIVIWGIGKIENSVDELEGNEGHIRGAKYVSHGKKEDGFTVTIGGVPVHDESASKHLGFAGSTGTGKSTALKEVLTTLVRRVEERGDKAICIDNRGEFISLFGGGADKILNPFDGRSAKWSPFAEIRDPRVDFRMLSRSLYPSRPNSQPEWDDFAKNLFANVMMKLAQDPGRSPDPGEVLRLVTMAEKEELEGFLKGTSSSISSSAENAKMFAGIRSTLANALDTWSILDPSGTFSIREWVRSPEGGFLWLPYMPQHRASLEYLISGWIDLAINEILSLGENRSRKIWLLVDETTAIGKIPILIDGLTLGRKPGLSVILGFQSVAQLKKVYGDQDAQTVVSNTRNKLVLAQGSHLDAQFWADELGKREYIEEERSENRNRGATTHLTQPGSSNRGSGDSVNYRIKTEHIVLPSELIDLPDNTGYLRVAGAGGISRVKIPWIDLEQVMEPYIPSTGITKEGA